MIGQNCDPVNPLQQVLRSCQKVYDSSTHIKVNMEEIDKIALSISQNSEENRKVVEWDTHNWHYSSDAFARGNLTCQYVFVMDSLNFCFWPTPGLEYDILASSLKLVLENDASAFNADNLCGMTADVLQSWFPGFDIPLLEERVDRLRELGQALMNDFNGLASNMVIKASNSVVKLVKLILMHFPGFRDTSIFQGQLIHFYKRAQILVGDLWAAYGRTTDKSDPYYFYDIDQLTMFADYRVPQILRSIGIFEYSSELSSKIDAMTTLPFGSEEEIEIRACCIIAVELIKGSLRTHGLSDVHTIEIDWLLWQWGERVKDSVPPHHRTLTIYY